MKLLPIGKFILETPSDNPNSEFYKSHILYDRAFGDVIQEISSDNPHGAIIDIGANIGDSAAMFSTNCVNPILCVEGSERYVGYLRANAMLLHSHVTVIDKFVVPEAYIENSLVYQEERGTGELRNAGPVGDGDETAIHNRLTIDQIYRQAIDLHGSVALFKSDTDGMDSYIINDALKVHDGIFFFECDLKLNFDPTSQSLWSSVFDTFEEKQYSTIIFDNFGLPIYGLDSFDKRQLQDLFGYLRAQFMTGDIRIHYFDIWMFPPKLKHVFDRAMERLRRQLLKPSNN